MRYYTKDIYTLINNQRTGDLVQLNDASGWPDYKNLPIAQPEPHTLQPQLRSTSIPLRNAFASLLLCT